MKCDDSAEAIVCGAGTAGLAAAAALRAVGVDPVVLERADGVGASWRTRYDGLRLDTQGWMSTQPGYRASRRRYGEFPSRDAWIQYLEDYAIHHRIDVRFGTQVRQLESADGGWRVETDREDLQARFVVVATGFDHDPNLPDWPGRNGFGGELIHSSAYRNPGPYSGHDVLVVGPDTTGSEVAALLARGGAGRVRVACRTPPNLTVRKILGTSVNITTMGWRAPSRRRSAGVSRAEAATSMRTDADSPMAPRRGRGGCRSAGCSCSKRSRVRSPRRPRRSLRARRGRHRLIAGDAGRWRAGCRRRRGDLRQEERILRAPKLRTEDPAAAWSARGRCP